MVVAGAISSASKSCSSCCPVLNFFISPETAEDWLARHPEVSGQVISVAEAAAAGRAVFGDVLALT